jgi:poly(3-hydroxybutyrate) depolymerase
MLVRAPASNHLRAAVIMLHGYTATPEGEEAVTGWTALMGGTDVAVVYPEGSPTPSGGYGWTTGAAHDATTGTDDVADLVNVISQLVNLDCVAPDQIMVAGESNGSGLGLVAACDPRMRGKVKLFALAIPAVDPNVTAHCAGAQHFPLLVIASQLDQTVPYSGTLPDGQQPFTAPLTWFEQIAASVNGCEGIQMTPVPDGMHYSYMHCLAPSNFFAASDGHHTWPGGPTGAGGLSPGVFPAAKVAWCASGLAGTPPPVNCTTIMSTYGLSSTTELNSSNGEPKDAAPA